MQEHERTLRPALAAIVLICFFMPFIKISCGQQTIVSITGLDLALGKTIEQPDFFSETAVASEFADRYRIDQSGSTDQTSSDDQAAFGDTTFAREQYAGTDPANPFGQMDEGAMKIDTEPTAAAALVLTIMALLSALGAGHRAMQVSAVCSGVVAALLLVFKANAGGDMPSEFIGVISLEWTTAFWIALIGSAVLALFTFRLLSQSASSLEKPRLVIQTHTDKAHSESAVQ
jgi:lysylphosphatidylglycerol synthetase-like protein (DUF2156 family)